MTAIQDILGMTSGELARSAALALPSGAGVSGKIYARAFVTGSLEPGGLGLSPASEHAWRGAFKVGLLEFVKALEEEGEQGITTKALFATEDGERIECVRVPMHGNRRSTAHGTDSGEITRYTICISSQVGCRRGCAFCETGRSGLVRDLTAAEILSQLVTAKVRLGWECQNVVFMGMGEPLDNFRNVAQALAVLADRRGLSYSQERVTVCTSGPPGGIALLRSLGLKRLNLSISLNSGDDAARSRIMSVNREHGLEALAAELAAYPQRRNFALGLNYCLMPGINDSRDDARSVAAFRARVGRAVVNLIPYNPGSAPVARAPTEAEIERFALWLSDEGCDLKRRSAKGGGIMAGCGQLGGR